MCMDTQVNRQFMSFYANNFKRMRQATEDNIVYEDLLTSDGVTEAQAVIDNFITECLRLHHLRATKNVLEDAEEHCKLEAALISAPLAIDKTQEQQRFGKLDLNALLTHFNYLNRLDLFEEKTARSLNFAAGTTEPCPATPQAKGLSQSPTNEASTELRSRTGRKNWRKNQFSGTSKWSEARRSRRQFDESGIQSE